MPVASEDAWESLSVNSQSTEACETRVTVHGHRIAIGDPGKILVDGDPPVTKAALIDYYRAVAGVALPYLASRPLTLERYPDGTARPGFFQQDIGRGYPAWIERARVDKEGGVVHHPVCGDEATMVYLVAQDCVTPHVWLSRADLPRRPDRLVFDLDPGEGGFDSVRVAARLLRELLEDVGLVPAVMTTGSRGVHLAIVLDRSADFEVTRRFARDTAIVLARRHPDTLTTEVRKTKRRGRLYLDISRNSYGQSSVAPYGVRARPGAPVATPLAWEELDEQGMNAQSYHIFDLPARLDGMGDPWQAAVMRSQATSLVQAREKLDELLAAAPGGPP
jgi:bifunctional non-homologous end joining protein LigD